MINYQKRKNTEMFRDLNDKLLISKHQNYIPMYQRFFSLNESNYNNVNLNNKWHVNGVIDKLDINSCFKCKLKNSDDNIIKKADAFVKFAPLLDPFKYLIGKYDIKDKNLFNLPTITSDSTNTHDKILDVNNVAYVDGLFSYLNSMLLNEQKFIHGVDYYGSFLGIKREFQINVADDMEFLKKSDFFKKNKDILFKFDDNYELEKSPDIKCKPPIKIGNNTSIMSSLSLDSINDDLFEDMFTDNDSNNDSNNETTCLNDEHAKLNEVLFDFENMLITSSLKSNSSCSSRSSHTNDGDEKNNNNDSDSEDVSNDSESDNNSNCSGSYCSESGSSYTEEVIYVTIPEFPVQVIFMEKCEDTFDNLILSDSLNNDEYISALMQIIMILLTYQKVFAFTHNDLHTNNVMYNKTKQEYIFYRYQNRVYKVPTYGRIYKMIDFGRSIYKVKGKIFCSDSFKNGGDAATQYNTEPYLDEKKPRVEPNYSFDLCRLACSIYDYIIDDMDDSMSFKKIILDMCKDDSGINLLYKSNGVERYPDFKLYKMIARCVHNHTPQRQLERAEFKQFEFLGKVKCDIIDIDSYPVLA